MNILPKNRQEQQALQEILEEADEDGNNNFSFHEFLHVMRQFYDLQESLAFTREREVAKAAGFSVDEVREFREIFNQACTEENSNRVSIMSVKTLLRNLGVTMTPATMQDLREVFLRFAENPAVGHSPQEVPVGPAASQASASQPHPQMSMEHHGGNPAGSKKDLDFPSFLRLISELL